jgi:hypothetical protein
VLTETITTGPDVTVGQSTLEPSFQYGGSYLRNAVQSFQQEDTVAGSPRDELHQYLQSDIETTTDILGWWGVSQYLFECGHVTNGTSPPLDIRP